MLVCVSRTPFLEETQRSTMQLIKTWAGKIWSNGPGIQQRGKSEGLPNIVA